MAKEFAVPEFSLPHEEKKKLEEEYFGGNEDKVKEKRWEKRAKESLKEIERMIDEGLTKKKEEEKKEEKKEEKEEVKKEIIYEGKNGYIMKVSKKEGNEYKISYYLVTKIENIEEALDKLSSYKPIIED
ncbi:MAG: hypothetical protein FE044_02915 [Thermoplasmata archaeon]|nr:MAG: hypothetical protein FE044_02915 [Thermoplasmata archaeon]MCD6573542.1 hypothetical protein [Thermoplasmata archaeon]